jgi:head-tail adaptor
MATAVGLMRERLVVQRNDPPTLSVSSLTRSSTTATVTTTVAHGYLAGDYVTIAGSLVVGYNSSVAGVKIVTVPASNQFTFTCNGSLTTPATGTITVTYKSNAQGGFGANGSLWRTLDSIAAEMIPLGASERLQLQAMQSDLRLRFRVRARADIDPTMRLLWTPSAPAGAQRQTLALIGPPLPCEDGRTFMYLEAAQVAA